MTELIRLVQGNTRPQLVMAVTNEITGEPINFSDPTTTVRMHFRELDAPTVKATITCMKLPGRLLSDLSVDYSAPYDVPGAGGRICLDWPEGALDTAGSFQGEIEVVFPDGQVQTVFNLIQFYVREQIGA